MGTFQSSRSPFIAMVEGSQDLSNQNQEDWDRSPNDPKDPKDTQPNMQKPPTNKKPRTRADTQITCSLIANEQTTNLQVEIATMKAQMEAKVEALQVAGLPLPKLPEPKV